MLLKAAFCVYPRLLNLKFKQILVPHNFDMFSFLQPLQIHYFLGRQLNFHMVYCSIKSHISDKFQNCVLGTLNFALFFHVNTRTRQRLLFY